MEFNLKNYINYISLLSIIFLCMVYCIGIKKELKYYEIELETLKNEKIKVLEDSLEDIKKRNIEFENSNAKLKTQIRQLRELSHTDNCLIHNINPDVIKLLRDAEI